MSRRCGAMQRGSTGRIHQTKVGAVQYQQFDDLQIANTRCCVDRRFSTRWVLRSNHFVVGDDGVSATHGRRFQQQLDAGGMPGRYCRLQGCLTI